MIESKNSPAKLGIYWASSIFGLISSGLFFAMASVISAFTSIFVDLGADLPVLTIWFLQARPFFVFAGIVGLLALLVWLLRIVRPVWVPLVFKLVTGYAVIAVLLFVLCFVAMYLPIINV